MKDRRDRVITPNLAFIRTSLQSNLPPGTQLSKGALEIALNALSAGVRPKVFAQTVYEAGLQFSMNGRTGKVGPFCPGREAFGRLIDHTFLTRAENNS